MIGFTHIYHKTLSKLLTSGTRERSFTIGAILKNVCLQEKIFDKGHNRCRFLSLEREEC